MMIKIALIMIKGHYLEGRQQILQDFQFQL